MELRARLIAAKAFAFRSTLVKAKPSAQQIVPLERAIPPVDPITQALWYAIY